MRVAAVVPAAGRGERMGPGVPKALRPLAGEPMLLHAVRALAAARHVDLVVVAAPADELGPVRAALSVPLPAELLVVAGGETRRESVALALAVLPEDVDVVLVHDAARPLAPSALADTVVDAVRDGADAVVPALPVTDTVKLVDERGQVTATVPRAALRAAQTPQGFRRSVLAEAHRLAGSGDVTDDAGLVESLGRPVLVLPGHPEAFKVTGPLDLVLAETVLSARGQRVGAPPGVRTSAASGGRGSDVR